MDSQSTGQGFIAKLGSLIFSQREPLGTSHAQLTKTVPFLLACYPWPVPGRSLVGADRLDLLGEGASTDPRLASCGLEVRWEGWSADR